jgi:protein O-mannosyl-transferase
MTFLHGQHQNLARVKFYLLLILAFFPFILYYQTLFHDYALDDIVVIEKNQFTQQGIAGIDNIFLNDSFKGYFDKNRVNLPGGRYRPLSIATFALEFELFGLSPGISHLINIILYSLTGILIFFLILQYIAPIVLKNTVINHRSALFYLFFAFGTAMLFVTHPLHIEVVSNIKGRDELMALIFSLISVIFICKYVNSGRILFILISAFSLFLGLLSKESSIPFIIIIPVFLYYFGPSLFQKKQIRYVVYSIVPLLITFFIYIVLRYVIVGFEQHQGNYNLMNNPYLYANISDKYATIFYTFIVYLKLLIFPHPLTVDYYPYHITIINITNVYSLLGILILVMFLAGVFLGFLKKELLSFCLLFFLIAISVVSNVFINIGVFMSERFMYIPSFAYCLFLSWMIFIFLTKKYFKFSDAYRKDKKTSINMMIPGITVLSVIVILYSIKVYDRVPDWRNDFTLFSKDVKTSSNSAFSNKSYGNHLIEESLAVKNEIKKQQFLKKALFHLQKAIEIVPSYVEAIFLAGNAQYLYNQDIEKSFTYYRKVLVLTPDDKKIFTNIEIMLSECQDVHIRMKLLNELLSISPANERVNYLMGKELNRQKKYHKAIPFLKKAINLAPENASNYLELGLSYGYLGDFHKAISFHKQALQYDPNNTLILKNLGVLHKQTGDMKKSNKYFQLSEKNK